MSLAETLAALRARIQQRVEGRVPAVPDFRTSSLDELSRRNEIAGNWAPLVGTVNPRPAGPLNAAVQGMKKILARALGWYVRPQREFNQAVVESLRETAALFADCNRNLMVLVQVASEAERKAAVAQGDLAQLRQAFESWKEQTKQELAGHARSLEGRITANVTSLNAVIEELRGELVRNIERLDQGLSEIQQNFWRDFAAHRDENARRFGDELRLIRQRLRTLSAQPGQGSEAGSPAAAPASPHVSPPAAGPAGFDYVHFEERFRGSEEEIRTRQAAYVPYFQGREPVLDVACGRGEFLLLLRQKGIEARGVDLDPDMAARCRDQGLDVAGGDAFAALEALPDASVGGVFSAQFIEHLEAAQYIRLIALTYRKLRPGGVLLLETQNPECLAIFSQNFFVDPTHVRPVPPAQLRFFMEEAGFHELKTHYSSPVFPQLPVLPPLEPAGSGAAAAEAVGRWNQEAERFNRTYFGYQDYAMIGRKPGDST